MRREFREWLPPALLSHIAGWRGRAITFDGNYSAWSNAREHSKGYESSDILDRVSTATEAVRRGEAAYERDGVLFNEEKVVWPVFGALMTVAAQSCGRLDVLDFGGSLGSLYWQHRRLLNQLPDVRWSVVEQAHFAEYGAEHLADGTLRFYPGVDTCVAENAPNVIVLSSVLQYLPEPQAILEILSAIDTARILIIDRTPVAQMPASRLVIQHVPPSIYPASYPMWVFAESALKSWLELHWKRIDRIFGPEPTAETRDGLRFRFEGWILERKSC